MPINNPASPTDDTNQTSQQSRGGLFSDTGSVGIDTSGMRGEQGPAGPAGPAGPQGPMGNPGADGFTYIPIFYDRTGVGGDVNNASLTLTDDATFVTFARNDNTLLFQSDGTLVPNINTQLEAAINNFVVGQHALAEGPQGPIGPMGLPGTDGAPGAAGVDGDTFVPIFYDRTGAGGDVANASLTLSETATFVTYARDSDTRIFNSDGSLVTGVNAQLETLINNFVIGQHSIGTGAQGLQGPAGPTGPAGPEGPQGPQGNAGPQGPMGDPGRQGDQGATGPRGAQGEQGVQGLFDIDIFMRSATRPTTEPMGGSFNITTGELTPPTGWVGPEDIDTLSGTDDLYESRATVNPRIQFGVVTPSWSLPFEAGGTGPAGPQGPQGDQGPIGPEGPAGAQGPVGPQGPAGPQGNTGDRGPVGATGATGATGAQGPAGQDGADGADGMNGVGEVVDIYYAEDASGTAARRATNPTDPDAYTGQRFIGFSSYFPSEGGVRPTPTQWIRFVGRDGMGGGTGGGINFGTELPTDNTSAGDAFVLILANGDNTPGYYYRNSENNAWVKDAVVNAERPIPVWDSTVTYVENDQVLRLSGSVESLYIARNTSSLDPADRTNLNRDPSSSQDYWTLVRSGIVSIQGPDDPNPAPLTNNVTLHLLEGSGINITRRDGSADFTISQRASGHSDADDFGEGYAYSYYANFGFEERRQHEGIVGSRGFIAVITEVHRDERGVRLVTETDVSSAIPSGGGNPYGFAVTDTPDRGDRTSLAPGATDDIIVYCTLDVPRNIYVSQVDPVVRTQADLETIFGLSNSITSRTGLSIGVNGFYTLNEHSHSSQYEPATWARDGNTDPIPETDNKLNNVDVWARASDTTTNIPDGHLGGVETWALQSSTDSVEQEKLHELFEINTQDGFLIDDSWLPNRVSSIIDASTNIATNTRRLITATTVTGVDDGGFPIETTTQFIAFEVPQAGFNFTPSSSLFSYRVSDRTSQAYDITVENRVPGTPVPTFSVVVPTGFTVDNATPTTGSLTDFTVSITDINDATLIGDHEVMVTGTFIDDPLAPANTRTVIERSVITIQDNRALIFQTLPIAFDPAAGAPFNIAIAEDSGASFTPNMNQYDLTHSGATESFGPTSDQVWSVPATNAVWATPGDATLRVRAVDANTPTRNYDENRTVRVYREYFFWTGATPSAASDFMGPGGQESEFAAGLSLMTTGSTQADWYLAYPADIMTTFRYRVHGSANFVRPDTVSNITRGTVDYQIFRFSQVTPGTTFDVEA